MSSGYYLTSSFYYFNLGSHMMYILRNRLEAQSVKKQKVIRILQDISNAVFKQHFITSLVVVQDPFTVVSLKDVFSRLAHSSIMKLDQSSMDKMFYLMLMSVKKQLYLCSSPLQLYTLTLGHLLNISKFLQGSEAVGNIQFAIAQFQKSAARYSFIQYVQIREYMLSQLEKFQTKIVNFIEAGLQMNDGRMIFRLRNSHNQKSIGSATNQTEQDCLSTPVNPQNQLFYINWVNWKTSLVIDYAQDYKKSSQRRNNKPIATSSNTKSSNISSQQQRSLGDILNFKSQDIQNFQVKFDQFEGQLDTGSANDYQYEDLESKQSIAKKMVVTKQKTNNVFKSKIQMEFSDLKIDKNQEEEDDVDLLDMMDN